MQRLATDLAARLAQVPDGRLDDAIVVALRTVGESLRMDVAFVWQQARSGGAPGAAFQWNERGSTWSPWLLQQVAQAPFLSATLDDSRARWFTTLEALSDPVDRERLGRLGLQSAAILPLTSASEGSLTRRVLMFGSTSARCQWTPGLIEQLRLIAGVISLALARRAEPAALDSDSVSAPRMHEPHHEPYLRPADRAFGSTPFIVAASAAMRRALADAERVAVTPSTVLLLGETGVGKEVLAQVIHELSVRRARPMVRVNCAAIPGTLIESELFGRERGAYTDAVTRQRGRFESADRSTLFLDEIGELSTEVQVKLLRVLEDRVIERLGSTTPIKVDVRIIAATNRNLEQALAEKSFREDLFYRLNVFPIVIPPLRERPDDIAVLAWRFADEVARTLGKQIDSISPESMQRLQQHRWPGNVRELRNVIERAVITARGPQLTIHDLQPAAERAQTATTLRDAEIAHIRATLETTRWRIRGAGGAAERLALPPTTLESRMARLGITRPAKSPSAGAA
jgi:transcriptional regulator with GAF, ATPase, and Fis domain